MGRLFFIFCTDKGNFIKKYNTNFTPRIGETIGCSAGSFQVSKIHHMLSDEIESCTTFIYADKMEVNHGNIQKSI